MDLDRFRVWVGVGDMERDWERGGFMAGDERRVWRNGGWEGEACWQKDGWEEVKASW